MRAIKGGREGEGGTKAKNLGIATRNISVALYTYNVHVRVYIYL